MPAATAMDRKQADRRVSKPLMEKRRRARINHSLTELKSLLTKAESSPRQSKLEKADILEMAVRHLQELHRQQRTASLVNDPHLTNKFRVGFEECAREVEEYLARAEGVELEVKRRVAHHLARRAKDVAILGGNPVWECVKEGSTAPSIVRLQTSALPQNGPLCSGPSEKPPSPCLTSDGVPQVRLVPRRLPNGDLALVLPHQGAPSDVPSSGAFLCPVSAFRLIVNDPPNRLDEEQQKGGQMTTYFRDTPSSSSSSDLSELSVEILASVSGQADNPLLVHRENETSPTQECVWRPW